MSQKHCHGPLLRNSISEGVEALVACVGSTLGPKGQNVILRSGQFNPIITKDGITVAKFFKLEDAMSDLGVQVVKQASLKTHQDAGDGTTTSIVIAAAIIQEAQRYLMAGTPPVEIQRSLQHHVHRIIEYIESYTVPIKSERDIRNIATISANNDYQLGEIIACAIDKVGQDGSITVQNNHSPITELDLQTGFKISKGYISDQFLQRPDSYTIKHRNPFILVSTQRLRDVQPLYSLFENVYKAKRPLIVVGDVVEEQVLAALIFNHVRGNFECVAINAPLYGRERHDFLSDLALTVGATLIDDKTDLTNVQLDWFGTAGLIEITKNETTIMNGAGNPEIILTRTEALQEELLNIDNLEEGQKIQDRISRLAGAVGVIKVGGSTDIEAQERTHRVEDALEAVQAAIKGGILPGGGTVLLRASHDRKIFDAASLQNDIGVRILQVALRSPLKTLADNSGLNYYEIVTTILRNDDFNFGLDFATEDYVNLVKAGIVDPFNVTKAALLNAVSAASTLLMANYAVVEE